MLRLILILLSLFSFLSQAGAEESASFKLPLRSRVELGKETGHFNVQWKSAEWDARKTAVVVCDMWDKHWCEPSTARVGELAARMNELVCEARRRGALVIHCPSDTMEYYKDWPQYKLAAAAPVVETKTPLQRWRKLDLALESALPIDDADGGCDCATPIKSYKAWSHQIDAIKIEAADAITDSSQAYFLMRQRGIENVLVMGVHLNMCVLGRPFSIRQLVSQGLNVALVRDMTDTMYDPTKRPYVSHFTGNDLMLEHVEKFWCPSVSSADILGGKEFRFSGDVRPRLVIVSAEDEYKTAETLPAFALSQLGKDFSVGYVFGGPRTEHSLQGIEQIKDADILLIAMRRRILLKAQVEIFKAHVAAGKALISIRTGVHALAPMARETIPPDCASWDDFDKTVLGCNYNNHYAAKSQNMITPVPAAKDNPILKGVEPLEFATSGTLYKVAPLDPKATLLLMGTIKDAPGEFVAWTLVREKGQRVFVTTLGHPDDFKLPQFVRLLKNGLDWAAGK